MPRILRRVLFGAGVMAAALILGLLGGMAWGSITRGDPGEGKPQPAPTSAPVSP